MRGYARIVVVAVLSVSIAWGLSWLPDPSGQASAPVFQSNKPFRLTETNMVDALVGLPLELRIAKADFQQSVMSVDLFLPAGVMGERFVYHDLYELSQLAWTRTTNVDRLLVRVMLLEGQGREGRELLLAMEAKRDQAEPHARLASGRSQAELKQYLESRYHFTYAPKWKEHS